MNAALAWIEAHHVLVTALTAVLGLIVSVGSVAIAAVYALFAWRLWQETRRQVGTAAALAVSTQKMLEMGERPYVSVDLYPDAGMDPQTLRFLVALRNHGRAPANILYGRMAILVGEREIQTQEQRPTAVVFPNREARFSWSFVGVRGMGAPRVVWRRHADPLPRGFRPGLRNARRRVVPSARSPRDAARTDTAPSR